MRALGVELNPLPLEVRAVVHQCRIKLARLHPRLCERALHQRKELFVREFAPGPEVIKKDGADVCFNKNFRFIKRKRRNSSGSIWADTGKFLTGKPLASDYFRRFVQIFGSAVVA